MALKDSRGVSGKTIDMEVRGGTYIIDPVSQEVTCITGASKRGNEYDRL